MHLFLGVVPGIFPWLEEPKIKEKMQADQVGVTFSYWAFRNKKSHIISKGVHDHFSFDGPIMIDSGAYSALNSGIKICIEEYSAFLIELKNSIQEKDIIVSLDVIGDVKKSFLNWKYLEEKIDYPILPVIHYPEKEIKYLSENYIGLGGMVPSFKINQAGSVYDVASWMAHFIDFKKKKLHGFGIGSPFHQIAFNALYSVDWIGWRRNAAVCSCYTPEGSTYINEARKEKKMGKSLTPSMFEQYAPPYIESYEQLCEPGTKGWFYRALWNVWWFLVANEHKEKLANSRYVKTLSTRFLE
jgi:hypothetical protein